ncbi:MAG: acetate--CoA ligase [Proteobacteria bacterium]|nr:MAG: acetate--CoA ligase [Pseudomonadota bacterium]
MTEGSKENITSMLVEERIFNPPAAFQKNSKVKSRDEYEKLRLEASTDPDKFWAAQARKFLKWEKDFTQVLDWQLPHAKWFADGKINASVQCLDKQIAEGRGSKTALIWEGEPGEQQKFTYAQMLTEVSQAANALKELGVKSGERVTIYLPMIPELMISVLACARIGAVHNVVFGGFSSEALSGRINDSQSVLLITADGSYRKGAIVDLKKNVDDAVVHCANLKNILIKNRVGAKFVPVKGRDHDWDALVKRQAKDCAPTIVESEHPLFLLYTSGSTGKPKGILHTTGGYLLGAAMSFSYIFDYREDDIYWCTADVGWITGHSYVIYGPMTNGATVVMYEGAPNFPDASRFWQIIERHKVSIFYTAPTAIRSCIRWGDEFVTPHDLSSLRILGTVGEPINPEAWMWYHTMIGKERCPIVDTWWQTETGSIMIAPLPGAIPTTPGTATVPFFGIDAAVVDESGNEVGADQGGFLVIRRPWPSMARTIYGDDERFKTQYWSQIPGVYFTGDGARKDANGYFWIMGRIDDVLNVSGHRLSTMEIESALVSHDAVAEAAVVGRPDEIKGEGIVAFVTLSSKFKPSDTLKKELTQFVAKQIGALARPDDLRFTDSLPKTRSGKIMRRLLRDIAAGRESKGDLSTLEDLGVMDRLRADNTET